MENVKLDRKKRNMIIAFCHVSIFYDYQTTNLFILGRREIKKDTLKIAKLREENYRKFNN